MNTINNYWLALIFCSVTANATDGITVPVNPFYKPVAPPSDFEPEAALCTQFSGPWQGSCDGMDGKKEIQMKIEQTDCHTLTVDGMVFRIDGMESATSNQGLGMSTGSTVLAWDQDKTKIVGSTQTIAQVLGKRKTIRYQYKNKFTMDKEGGTLRLSTEVQADTFINDFKKVNKGEMSCRLEKKIDDPKLKQ